MPSEGTRGLWARFIPHPPSRGCLEASPRLCHRSLGFYPLQLFLGVAGAGSHPKAMAPESVSHSAVPPCRATRAAIVPLLPTALPASASPRSPGTSVLSPWLPSPPAASPFSLPINRSCILSCGRLSQGSCWEGYASSMLFFIIIIFPFLLVYISRPLFCLSLHFFFLLPFFVLLSADWDKTVSYFNIPGFVTTSRCRFMAAVVPFMVQFFLWFLINFVAPGCS